MTQSQTPHPRNVVSRAIRSDQLRALVLGAIDAGFDPYVNGSGHLRLVNPQSGQSVTMSMTSNGLARAYQNTRAALRRAGYTPKEDAMPKGQRATEHQIEQIRTMRAAYIPIEEIARRTGLSEKAVTTHTPPEYLRGGAKYHPVFAAAAEANIEAFDAQTAVAVMDPPKVDDIDQEFGGADAVVQNGRVAGKTPPGHKMTPEQVEQLYAELAQGRRNLEIAASVGVSNWTVGQYRRKWLEEKQADRPTTEVGDRLVSYSEPTEEQRIEQPLDIKDVVLAVTQDYTRYPTIRGLVDRQKRYAQLYELAEKTHDDDVQLLVMSKMDLTGLEKEAVDLWHATHGQTTNGTGGHTDE